jgi:hypothetical protein
MLWIVVIGMLVGVGVGAVGAQEYTVQVVDLAQAGRGLQLRAVAPDQALLACDPGLGGFCYRVRLAPLTLTAISCPTDPSGVFVRSPVAAMGGPSVTAWNDGQTAVGSDEGVNGSYGFWQDADGTCHWWKCAGCEGSLLVGITTAGRKLGLGWYPPSVAPGLLRFFTFLLDPDGTETRLAGPGPQDRPVPTALAADPQAHCDVAGYLYQNVQADNTYTYQAFLRCGGALRLVDGPGGEDLWFTGVGGSGTVLALLGPQGTIGGDALLYDVATGAFKALPAPPATPGFHLTTLVPLGIDSAGQVVGFFAEEQAPCPPYPQACRQQMHGFLAVPVPAAAPPAGTRPKGQRPRAVHPKARTRLPQWHEMLEWQRWGFTSPGTFWHLLDVGEGTVVLSNGTTSWLSPARVP